MLITFRTDAAANITMFGDVAVALLKLMGQSGEAPGGILAADVPAALARLRTAIANTPQPAPADSDDESPSGEKPIPVSLRNRAFPLIQLLEAAAKKKRDVIWE